VIGYSSIVSVWWRRGLAVSESFGLLEQEERNMGLKDQIRGKVQANLERLASGCRDMATLLRLLHIPVEGGLSPSVQQASYPMNMLMTTIQF
jgi:hypothetical protein